MRTKDTVKEQKPMRIGDIDLGSRMERAVFAQHPDLPDTKLSPGDSLQVTYTLNYGDAPLTRFDQERKANDSIHWHGPSDLCNDRCIVKEPVYAENICYNNCSPSQRSGVHGHGINGINCPGKHKGTYPTYRAACVCDFTFEEIDGTPIIAHHAHGPAQKACNVDCVMTPITYPPTPSKDKEPEYKMKQTNAAPRGYSYTAATPPTSVYDSFGHGQHATPLNPVDPFMTALGVPQPMSFKSDAGEVPDTKCSSAVERVLTEAAKLAQQDPHDKRITARRLLFALINECRINPDGAINIILTTYNQRATNMAENAVRRALGMPEAPNASMPEVANEI